MFNDEHRKQQLIEALAEARAAGDQDRMMDLSTELFEVYNYPYWD